MTSVRKPSRLAKNGEAFVLILLAIVGAVVFFALNADENSEEVQPAISREKAAAHAADFLRSQFAVHADQSFVVFQSHDRLSGYLQKEHLTEAFAKTYPDFPIDYYEVELADSAGKKKYKADVDIRSGTVFGWAQTGGVGDPVNAPDPNMAKSWLAAMGYDPARFAASFQQSDGLWVFTDKKEQIGQAYLQIRIAMRGKIPVEFSPSFVLPQSFTGWMDHQQQSAERIGILGLLVGLLLTIGAIATAVIRKRFISFRRGLLLTLAFVAIYAIYNINAYPGMRAMTDNSLYGTLAVVFNQITILLMGTLTYLALTVGDSLWKSFGKKVWPAWREPDFGNQTRRAMLRGYAIAAIILGIQAVLFATEGRLFAVWSVEDPTSSIYNLFWPALFPLLAWAAAISEEAVYRLFGIALCKKLFRNTFIAMLIPSFFWAMLHVGYPFYPFYTRLIEVTILGLFFGLAFLRYGLLTSLFAHASMDSVLMGISIMYLGGTLNALTGVGYLLSPALIALFIKWLHDRKVRNGPPLRPATLR
ncbi:MAG TPA: CPBP family intramembrane glutamic endopeptidase [Bacilli bacterium]